MGITSWDRFYFPDLPTRFGVVPRRGSVEKGELEIGRVRRREGDLASAASGKAHVIGDRFDGLLHFVDRFFHLIGKKQPQREKGNRDEDDDFEHGGMDPL